MSDTITWPTGRYKLLQPANMPRTPGGADEFLDPSKDANLEVVYAGKPGRHMKPLDADAFLAFSLAGLNPAPDNAVVMGHAVQSATPTEDDDARLARIMAEAMGKAFATALPMAVSAVIEEMDRRGLLSTTVPKPLAAPPPPVQTRPLAPPPKDK